MRQTVSAESASFLLRAAAAAQDRFVPGRDRPAPQLCRNRACKRDAVAPRAILSLNRLAANHLARPAAALPRALSRAAALSRQTEAEDERKARLAAALRENLKRRKAQARARRASDMSPEDKLPPAQADLPRS